MQMNNLNHIFFGHLDINSLQNKFALLVKESTENDDVLLISEAEFGDIFLEYQFRIPGFALLVSKDRK